MKGILLALTFSGKLFFIPFTYTGIDYDQNGKIDSEEQALSCSIWAEKVYSDIAEHSWTDPRGQGWYLKVGSGTLQGHIC
jgi:hypothetical protein